MKAFLSILTALLLLFIDFKAVEHHHEDHELHVDCYLCIIQHTQEDNTTYEPKLNLFSIDYNPEFIQEPSQPKLKTLAKIIYSRAPPLV
ncbi:MAG: hypothetical protein N3C57_07900 [Aquificaceae bacterium]|nr:hypothetical protein [Aquificaceae bacterium]